MVSSLFHFRYSPAFALGSPTTRAVWPKLPLPLGSRGISATGMQCNTEVVLIKEIVEVKKGRLSVLAAVVGVGLLGTSCVRADSLEPPMSFGQAADSTDADRTITVTTLDTMAFRPAVIEAESGETILFRVRNTGRLPHEFMIGDEAEQEAHEEEMADSDMTAHSHSFSVLIEPGDTGELAWSFPESGNLMYGCHVPGHYDSGMKGAIEVGP
ncbi:MAG TPA: plastocyanin/azurin family copper-binding protein [Actinomycetota bacterium]|nr:plastocyanin/azurin family copper-binding protein [Actinomycetota bacterium]